MALLASMIIVMAGGGQAHADTPSMDKYLFWGEHNAAVDLPDPGRPTTEVQVGQVLIGEGMSTVDPSRTPQSGESFYLAVEYQQVTNRPELALNASVTVTLPAGLVRADDRLPIRCAGKLGQSNPLKEYLNTCGLAAASADKLTIVNTTHLSPAPAFFMTPGTTWWWFVPVRATAPLTATATATAWVSDGGLENQTPASTTAIVGDPASPIWQAYTQAPRHLNATFGPLDDWGFPGGGASRPSWIWGGVAPLVIQTSWQQRFVSFSDNAPREVFDTTTAGIHSATGIELAAWVRYGGYLGPAISDSQPQFVAKTLQTFVGGNVNHVGFVGRTFVNLTYRHQMSDPLISYNVHEQDIGWLGPESDNSIAGFGGGLRLEAISAKVNTGVVPFGQVCIQAHVQNIGWQDRTCLTSTDTQVYAGTTGKSLRLEAVKISLAAQQPDPGLELTLNVSEHVCYSAYVHGRGWQAEVCDGAMAGTTGQSLAIEELRIRVTP